MTDNAESRAREFLAHEYSMAGEPSAALAIRGGGFSPRHPYAIAARAILAYAASTTPKVEDADEVERVYRVAGIRDVPSTPFAWYVIGPEGEVAYCQTDDGEQHAGMIAAALNDRVAMLRADLATLPRPDRYGEGIEADPADFEVWQDDGFGDGEAMVAGASGPRESALRDAMHYAAVYAQDGPTWIIEVTRKRLPSVRLVPSKGGE